MRRGDELAEAVAGQRRDFGKRLARDQGRRKLARHRHRNLDCLAFEPGFDRRQRAVRDDESCRDVLERVGHAPARLDRGIALGVGIASAMRGGFRLGDFEHVFGQRDRRARRLAFARASKSVSNRNFFVAAFIFGVLPSA